MALIKESESKRMARDAIVLDLGDLQRQAQALRERAQADADRIVADARAERERILAGAYDEGFEKGRAEGRAEGHEAGKQAGREEARAEHTQALSDIERRWSEALDAFEGERDDLLLHARAETLDLALALAERIVRRSLDGDADAARRQLEAALELVVRPSKLRVRVRPAEAESVRQALPDLASRLASSPHVEVIEDDALSAGACVVATDHGQIDASVETQIERVLDALRPARPRSDAA